MLHSKISANHKMLMKLNPVTRSFFGNYFSPKNYRDKQKSCKIALSREKAARKKMLVKLTPLT
jgi:hypothetical protein